MNINVRVLSAQAQAQIKALQAQVRQLEGQLARSNVAAASPTGVGGRKYHKSLVAAGSQLQWTGRQLKYNFTLPLLLAGGAAAKFALDNEKAFTHVAKVYGDLSDATEWSRRNQDKWVEGAQSAAQNGAMVLQQELDALRVSFELLSSRYGIAQKEVLETAGAWAAAGVSGVRLAKSTELSIKAAILGDMALAKSTESLIAIQAQYGLSTAGLSQTLNELNSVENATGISMQGLIDGFARSAGAAREAGVDVRHLSAMLAALVPATGSAATAGNSLKTIISRVMAPTEEARKVMKLFGVDTSNAAWQASTAMERLQVLAGHMKDRLKETGKASKDLADDGYELSDSQKQVVATVLGSRYQMNRFLVLMRELNNEHGYYRKALESTEDREESLRRATKELNRVLESSPRQLAIAWETLKNASSRAIAPLIPHLIMLAQAVANMVQKFTQLNPSTQKFILYAILAVAALGPLISLVGSLGIFIGLVTKPLAFLIGLFISWRAKTAAAAAATKAAGGVIRKGLIAGLGAKVLAGISVGMRAFWLSIGILAMKGVTLILGAVGLLVPGIVAMLPGLAKVLRTIPLLFAAVSLGVTTALAALPAATATAVAASGAVLRTLPLLFAAVMMGVQRAMIAFTVFASTVPPIAAAAATRAVAAMAMIWRTLPLIFGAIMAGLPRIMAMAGGAMIAVQKGISLAMTGLWAATETARMAISRAFWIKMIQLNIAAVSAMSKIGVALQAALLSPWLLIAVAVAGVLYLLRDKISQIWNNIVAYFADSNNAVVRLVLDAWNALPSGVANALTAVVRIVQQAALQVYEWFSYLNPFAHHSPSLVENVEGGMERVQKAFAKAGGYGALLKRSYADIRAFGKAIQGLVLQSQANELAENRAKVKKFAPGALGAYNKLATDLKALNAQLRVLESRMQAQQSVVDRWTDRLDAANAALDRQQEKLDALTEIQDKWQDKLDEANDLLDKFANAPLKGMREMEEQIFQNQMAQTELRYEMMKMEEVYGTYDQIKSKIDAINGAQEILRGTQADLRAAGAGSEILGQYDAEMAKLDEQKDKYAETADKLADMQAKLDKLQQQAEKLDLVKAMKFDQLQHQIEMAANQMEEMSFEDIMSGIKTAQADIKTYGDKLDQATAAVDRQQEAVDRATEARDRIQKALDREQDKLDKIKDTYDDVSGAVNAVEDAMNVAVSSADALSAKADKAAKKLKGLKKSLSPAEQNFMDAAGGNFAQIGGEGLGIRKNWGSEVDDIKKFNQQKLDEMGKMFGDLDMLSPFKKKWSQFKGWVVGAWGRLKGAAKDFFGSIFSGVSFGDGGGGMSKALDGILVAWAKFRDFIVNNVIDPIKAVWRLFWPSIKEIFRNAWDGILAAWEVIGKEFEKFGPEMKPLWEAIQNIWRIVKPVLAVLIGAFVMLGKIIFSVIAKTIKPIIETLGRVIANIVQIVRGVLQVLIGIFTLDFKKVFAGLYNIFAGLFGGIGQLLWGAVKVVGKAVWGMVKGIWDFFVWLWDELIGHSIVPDIINGIFSWFKKLVSLAKWVWENVLKPIFGFFKKAWSGVKFLLGLWWSGIKAQWAALKSLGLWLWQNVLLPIYNRAKSLWDNWVKPALGLWWAGIKLQWAILKKVGTWLWNNVLKPVYDRIRNLWGGWVKPALRAWWSGIKTQWALLKRLGTWLWENVLKPAWGRIKDLWAKAKPELDKWWSRIKTAWNNLKTTARWLWDHVLKPALEKIKDLWSRVKTELDKWWSRIKTAWNALKGLGQWVKTNVMDPVVTKIKNAWTNLRDWLINNKGMLTNPVAGIVNTVIKAVNKIIGGLNRVSDVLPGVSWHIEPIPELARGGEIRRRAGRGFKTNGARAIVGEGKRNYPEFVIPTDPTHRNRARGLLAMAASKMRMEIGGDPSDLRKVVKSASARNPSGRAGGVPEFALGGWLSGTFNSAKKELAKLGKNAVGTVMNPALSAAESQVNKAGWTPVEVPPKYAISKLRQWVKDSDVDLNQVVNKAKEEVSGTKGAKKALAWARNQQGKPYIWGGVGPAGYDCSGFMSAITNVYRGKPPYSRVGATGSFPWPGFIQGARPSAFTIGSSPSYSGGIGHMAGTLANVNVESRGGEGVVIGSRARGYNDPGFTQMAHLARGAIVKSRLGRGTVARIGEGRYDEAVTPLPRDWKQNGFGGGDRNYYFYGDLEFPNIQNGDDAQAFLDNLDTLAKD